MKSERLYDSLSAAALQREVAAAAARELGSKIGRSKKANCASDRPQIINRLHIMCAIILLSLCTELKGPLFRVWKFQEMND